MRNFKNSKKKSKAYILKKVIINALTISTLLNIPITNKNINAINLKDGNIKNKICKFVNNNKSLLVEGLTGTSLSLAGITALSGLAFYTIFQNVKTDKAKNELAKYSNELSNLINDLSQTLKTYKNLFLNNKVQDKDLVDVKSSCIHIKEASINILEKILKNSELKKTNDSNKIKEKVKKVSEKIKKTNRADELLRYILTLKFLIITEDEIKNLDPQTKTLIFIIKSTDSCILYSIDEKNFSCFPGFDIPHVSKIPKNKKSKEEIEIEKLIEECQCFEDLEDLKNITKKYNIKDLEDLKNKIFKKSPNDWEYIRNLTLVKFLDFVYVTCTENLENEAKKYTEDPFFNLEKKHFNKIVKLTLKNKKTK